MTSKKHVNIPSAFNTLQEYINTENFKGYDPYDYLNSYIPFRWLGKWGQAIAIQVGKLNPINFRPLMGVSKGENPKGLGLLLKSYSILYRETKENKYLDVANYLFERIIDLKSPGKKHYCWGYDFVWANPIIVHPKYMPSSVVSSFVGQGIFEYYKATNNPKAVEVLKSAANYILEDIKCSKTSEGICFSYTEEKPDYCYNASALSAELLAVVYSITKEEKLKAIIQSAIDFILAHQKEDGHWNYSLNIETGNEREQIDFHQGFILCSLEHIKRLLEIEDKRLDKAIVNGLEYYKSVQFFETGKSLWRIPKEYPVEIHNQAQGIITFSELSSYDNSYLGFSTKIAEWTIENMQDKKGYFYYRKFKRYTNKIPYMRWSNSWMLLAMTTLMSKNRTI